MKCSKIFIYIILLFSVFSGKFAFSQTFKVEGVGTSFENARENAVTNAIKASVGEIIVAKEELNNDTFSQKIVSYSNSYVKKIDIISQDKVDDETYKVSLNVNIESDKLIGLLKEMEVAVMSNPIDQSTLLETFSHFDKNAMNEKNLKDYEALVEELLVTPLKEKKALIHIEIVDKLKALEPEKGSETFPFELRLKIYPDENYVAAVKRILKESAPNADDEGSRKIYEIDLSKGRVKKPESYRISSKKHNILYDKYLKNSPDISYRRLKLKFIDKNDEVMKVIYYCPSHYSYCYTLYTLDEEHFKKYSKTQFHEFEWLNRDYILLNNNSFASGVANNVFAKFELTKEEIMNLKDIKIGFVSDTE